MGGVNLSTLTLIISYTYFNMASDFYVLCLNTEYLQTENIALECTDNFYFTIVTCNLYLKVVTIHDQ